MYILLFNLAGPAILAWALMIFLPTWPVTRWIAARAVFPAYLAALYVIGVVPLLISTGPRGWDHTSVRRCRKCAMMRGSCKSSERTCQISGGRDS